ncbi:MAG TPA: urea ABC transporter ATP-binding protein UrtD [Gemmataceae bacterium]|jgi:urea transport system ATP-binding protein|nr:urea ABC transporter ATP-binding protein UrtD [Gemmataceae bacterium]
MGSPILHVENLTVSFSGFKALNGLNFSLQPGELRVVIGPNGAGKTTLLDVITGKTRPTAGRVYFRGEDITKLPEQAIAHRGIGRKFQTPNVFKSLTVLENLSLAVKGRRTVTSGLFRPVLNGEAGRVHEILDLIGLGHKARFRAGLLAHGEKQWLELGMVMAQDPELLLIDEPVAGMTPRESERTGELLLAMARKHTLIVIEHDMTFVRQIAHTVTVLDEGQLLCEGTVEEVQRNPKVIEVYLGQDREADAADRTALCVVR